AHSISACLSRDVSAAGDRVGQRAGKARPDAQCQLLHECAVDAAGRAHLCGRSLRTGQVCRAAGGTRPARARLQLPAAEQPVQRLQPHADSAHRLGRAVSLLTYAASPRGRTLTPPREVGTGPARGRTIEILEPGTQTTVQDLRGRRGLWGVGVPPSGAFDDYACALANLAVGNDPGA